MSVLTIFYRYFTSASLTARALWLAVKNKRPDEVRSLLENGTDPNHTLYWSALWQKKLKRPPPLHTSCRNGSLEILEMLIEAGASNRGGGKYNWTPLHYACFGGHKKVVVYLIEEAKYKIGK